MRSRALRFSAEMWIEGSGGQEGEEKKSYGREVSLYYIFLFQKFVTYSTEIGNLKSSYPDMFVPLGKSCITINGADHVIDLLFN